MKKKGIRLDWRRIVLLLLLVLFTVWILSRFTDLQDLGDTLLQAHVGWLLAATILHLGYFVMVAQLHKLAFSVAGVKASLRQILPVFFAMLFANAIAPSGGTAGVALFVDNAMRWGQSGARTAAGVVLALVADLSTLIPFILYGLLFLNRQGKLFFYDTISSLFFLLFIILLTAALLLARWKPAVLQHILGRAQRLVNRIGARFHRPELLRPDWAEDNARELANAGQAIVTQPRLLATTLAWALAMHVVNLAGLYLLFVALEQPVRLGTLVAGFSLGIVFWVVSVIPSGLAAVEGIMTLVFTALGIPPQKAAAVVLTFRAMNFWMPVGIGFFALRQVGTFQRQDAQFGREAGDGEERESESAGKKGGSS